MFRDRRGWSWLCGFSHNGDVPCGDTEGWWDAGTELVYLRARYLRPELGLFTSRDPGPRDVRRQGTLQGADIPIITHWLMQNDWG